MQDALRYKFTRSPCPGPCPQRAGACSGSLSGPSSRTLVLFKENKSSEKVSLERCGYTPSVKVCCLLSFKSMWKFYFSFLRKQKHNSKTNVLNNTKVSTHSPEDSPEANSLLACIYFIYISYVFFLAVNRMCDTVLLHTHSVGVAQNSLADL